jgi:glutathione S-transferase
MRPWVLLTQAGIPFEEVMVRFDSFEADSAFKTRIAGINPVGKVPVLVDDDFAVWDTLAIAEYLAERFAGKALWPADAKARARARSVCAEMHSGFSALRNHCPMNIEASLPEVGRIVWRDQAGVRTDIARIEAMWTGLLAEHGGPMLFGGFSVADAYYAPVCSRIRTYQLPVSPVVSAYVERVFALQGVRAWVEQALKEHHFVDFDEPYRASR